MRRTREWWARLTAEERSRLVYLERSELSGGSSAYLPDDCSECGSCGNPTLSGGWCSSCSAEHSRLIAKANGEQ